MYLNARYYDPSLGLFLSPDPIAADLNSYAYSYVTAAANPDGSQ